MAHYKRLAAAGHYRSEHPSPARPLRLRARPRAEVDAHDAQAMAGLMVAVPLGLACWCVLGGAVMMIGSLLG